MMEHNEVKAGISNCTDAHVAAHLPLAYEIEMHRLIEQVAYCIAEKDGFRCSPMDYWLAAENEVS